MSLRTLGFVAVLLLVGCGSEPATDTVATQNEEVVVNDTAASGNLATNNLENVADDTVVDSNPELVEATTEPTVDNQAVTTVTANTFGITPEEFGNRFVGSVASFDMPSSDWDGNVPELETGAVDDSFTRELSEKVIINGVVDKNGELKVISYMLNEDDVTNDAVLQLISMAGFTASTLSPDLPQEQTMEAIGPLIDRVMKQLEVTQTTAEASKVVDHINYTVAADEAKGIWITFAPVA